jgi:hypothetical protein
MSPRPERRQYSPTGPEGGLQAAGTPYSSRSRTTPTPSRLYALEKSRPTRGSDRDRITDQTTSPRACQSPKPPVLRLTTGIPLRRARSMHGVSSRWLTPTERASLERIATRVVGCPFWSNSSSDRVYSSGVTLGTTDVKGLARGNVAATVRLCGELEMHRHG